jgi:hypothetical protein
MRYRLAKCCSPQEGDKIVGFLKQDDDIFSVHRADCANIKKVRADRVVVLSWHEIAQDGDRSAGTITDALYGQLDHVDFAVLMHHQMMGVDYAAVVARSVGIPRDEAFIRHKKLRDLGLLERVEPRIIRYRTGIVDGKWIKHRNHTYYDLTELGQLALDRRAGEKSE